MLFFYIHGNASKQSYMKLMTQAKTLVNSINTWMYVRSLILSNCLFRNHAFYWSLRLYRVINTNQICWKILSASNNKNNNARVYKQQRKRHTCTHTSPVKTKQCEPQWCSRGWFEPEFTHEAEIYSSGFFLLSVHWEKKAEGKKPFSFRPRPPRA